MQSKDSLKELKDMTFPIGTLRQVHYIQLHVQGKEIGDLLWQWVKGCNTLSKRSNKSTHLLLIQRLGAWLNKDKQRSKIPK